MDQRCGLHDARIALTPQVGSGDFAEMGIDERHQLREGLGFAPLPAHQQNCYVSLSRSHSRCGGPFFWSLSLVITVSLWGYFAAVKGLCNDGMKDSANLFWKS